MPQSLNREFKTDSQIKGVGLGLRFVHFDELIANQLRIPWLEVIADDFLSIGPHHEKLLQLRANTPIVLHGIGLNLGGVTPLDKKYLQHLQDMKEKFQPTWISDHLCWSMHEGRYHHDLLPIPRTKEGLINVVARIQQAQDFLQEPLLIENITAYVEFKEQDFDEIEFITEITQQTGCFLLFDVNNIFMNEKNLGLSVEEYFKKLPWDKVRQVHLAGGENIDDLWVDTHGSPVAEETLSYYKRVISKYGPIPAMIERDMNIPSLEVLNKERLYVEESLR